MSWAWKNTLGAYQPTDEPVPSMTHHAAYAKFVEVVKLKQVGRLADMLTEAEEAHAASGDDGPWQSWYAAWLLGVIVTGSEVEDQATRLVVFDPDNTVTSDPRLFERVPPRLGDPTVGSEDIGIEDENVAEL